MFNFGMQKMMMLVPLMDKRLEDLDVNTVQGLLKAIGSDVVVNDELLSAGLALLAGENIHSVADMIKSPESIQMLVNTFARGIGVGSKPVPALEQLETNVVEDEPLLFTAAPGWRLQ